MCYPDPFSRGGWFNSESPVQKHTATRKLPLQVLSIIPDEDAAFARERSAARPDAACGIPGAPPRFIAAAGEEQFRVGVELQGLPNHRISVLLLT